MKEAGNDLFKKQKEGHNGILKNFCNDKNPPCKDLFKLSHQTHLE